MRRTGLVLFSLVGFVVAVVLLTFDLGGGEPDVKTRVANTTSTTGGPTTTTRGEVKYTVMRGDTLISISEKFGVTQKQIMDANQLANPDALVAGQVLTIPPKVVVRLVVRPRKAILGETIELTLKGAQPGEYITFSIRKPDGSTFTGQPHYTSDDEISTTYAIGATDPAGTYTASAKGDQITTAEKTFVVVAPTPPTTAG